MGLAENFIELDMYVQKMKNKLLKVEYKHKDEKLIYDDIKNHLILEILELFNLNSTYEGKVIRYILCNQKVKIDESIDVANLCFALDLLYQKEKYKNITYQQYCLYGEKYEHKK